jgi:hypothetical protein
MPEHWQHWRKLRYTARILRGALGQSSTDSSQLLCRETNGILKPRTAGALRRKPSSIAEVTVSILPSLSPYLNTTRREHTLHVLHVLHRRHHITQAPSLSDASMMVNIEWTPQPKYSSICCFQPRQARQISMAASTSYPFPKDPSLRQLPHHLVLPVHSPCLILDSFFSNCV